MSGDGVVSHHDYYSEPGVVADYAQRGELFPAERAILDALALADAALLDIGVGGGRTTRHLVPLVGRYVGVDIAAAMVERCRVAFAGERHATFEVCDARDLSRFADGEFDIVLFSYNGIDAFAGADRATTLREMVRTTAPGGAVAFSTHNINALRMAPRLRSPRGVVALLRWLRLRRSVAALNPDLRATLRGDEAMLRERRSGTEVLFENCHVNPAGQVGELRAAGLTDVHAVSEDGRRVEDEPALRSLREPFTYYVGRKPD